MMGHRDKLDRLIQCAHFTNRAFQEILDSDKFVYEDFETLDDAVCILETIVNKIERVIRVGEKQKVYRVKKKRRLLKELEG